MATEAGSMLARDVMHEGCTCVSHDSSCLDAAKTMAEDGVGALPICGPDDRLIGMLTDRDIVVRCIAKDLDVASCTAGELASGRVVWCFDDMSIDEVLAMMEEHLVRRIPVVDRDRRLVGIISQADIAMHLSLAKAGELVEAVSSAPPRQAAAF